MCDSVLTCDAANTPEERVPHWRFIACFYDITSTTLYSHEYTYIHVLQVEVHIQYMYNPNSVPHHTTQGLNRHLYITIGKSLCGAIVK